MERQTVATSSSEQTQTCFILSSIPTARSFLPQRRQSRRFLLPEGRLTAEGSDERGFVKNRSSFSPTRLLPVRDRMIQTRNYQTAFGHSEGGWSVCAGGGASSKPGRQRTPPHPSYSEVCSESGEKFFLANLFCGEIAGKFSSQMAFEVANWKERPPPPVNS